MHIDHHRQRVDCVTGKLNIVCETTAGSFYRLSFISLSSQLMFKVQKHSSFMGFLSPI